jgi:hypothetical protein
MKVDFVDSQKAEHGVQPVLQALEDTPVQIAPSTYCAAKARPASARSRRDEELTALIERIHAENYGVYGGRKIWHDLHRQGLPVARCTVERLMRESGLRGSEPVAGTTGAGLPSRRPLRKYWIWRQTQPDHGPGGSRIDCRPGCRGSCVLGIWWWPGCLRPLRRDV